MALPTALRTYTHSVNNRITFVSLVDTMSRYLYGIKNFLVATMAYTVKYTCDGATGPSSASDHTDRWTSQANVVTRGANSVAAQSFCVLTDANGCDILLAFQGSADHIARIAFSGGGLYTPAGTATFQPTATDEMTVIDSTSLINSTASADRVWHAMASTDKKSFRVFIARSNVCVGAAWGVETITSALVAPAVFSPATVGHCATTFAPATFITSGSANSHAVVAKPVISSVGVAVTAGFDHEATTAATTLDGVNCELQGSVGALVFPLAAWSTTSGAKGKLGNLIDYYRSGNSKADGDVDAGKTWIHLTFQASAAAGVIWPWNGSTTPQMA